MGFKPAFGNLEQLDLRAPIAGLFDSPKLDLLPDSAAQVCTNFHFDRKGLQRRQGRVRVGDNLATHTGGLGGYHFRTDAGVDQLLRCQEGYLYKLVGTNWLGVVSGLNPANASDLIGHTGKLGYFVQYKGRIHYVRQGTDSLYYDGTAIGSWGNQMNSIGAPLFASEAGGGSLNLLESYYWVVTYYNPTTGNETNPSAPASHTLTGANNLINAEAQIDADWDPAWSEMRIYRSPGSTVGDPQLYKFEDEITISVDLTAFVQPFSMSILDGDLGAEVAFDNDPPPDMDQALLYKERIVGYLNSTVYFSKAFNPTAFPAVNQVPVEDDAGDPIQCMFVLLGNLYVVKRYGGIFLLAPQVVGGIFTFNVQLITRDFGCSRSASLVVVENYAYWLHWKGIARFDGTNVVNISEPRIRQRYQELADGAQFQSSFGIHDGQPDKQYVRFSIPDPTESNRVYHLIYDISLDAWFEETAGLTVADTHSGVHDRILFNVKDSNNTTHVYTLDNQGNCFRLRTNTLGVPVWSDNGTAYVSTWRSKWFGDGLDEVMPVYMDAEIGMSAAGVFDDDLHFILFRDNDLLATDDDSVVLYDYGDISREARINWKAERCRRFALEATIESDNSDLLILRMRPGYVAAGPRLGGT